MNLAVGANTITVMVEAEDGTHGDLHGHGHPGRGAQRAAAVVADGGRHAGDPSFAANVTSYTAVSDDAGAEVKQITVTAQAVEDFTAAITPVDADATTPDSHQVALRVGDNTITGHGDAGLTTSQVYTVKVTRIAASNAYLGTLTLSGVTLEPKFASGTTSYTASVPNDLDDDLEGVQTIRRPSQRRQ